jgi:hypothetical protein
VAVTPVGAPGTVGEAAARLWSLPAAIAVTPESPAGTLVWPLALEPQATTVPLDRRARLWCPPAAIA